MFDIRAHRQPSRKHLGMPAGEYEARFRDHVYSKPMPDSIHKTDLRIEDAGDDRRISVVWKLCDIRGKVGVDGWQSRRLQRQRFEHQANTRGNDAAYEFAHKF